MTCQQLNEAETEFNRIMDRLQQCGGRLEWRERASLFFIILDRIKERAAG
jgi:hypothetical protein